MLPRPGVWGPQKLWDKWCKILHSGPLLALNFIIETSFFCTIFLIFSAIVQDKRPFFTTFDYIVAVIQALVLLGADIACLIKVLLYRRNIYNFVKRHSELIAIFLKKTRICNPDNSVPLRLRFHLR